jgi:DNA mismatch endonuclease (patch repair protein)
MARFGRRDTAPELALRRALHARGRRFFVDRQISTRTRARADLVFPRARVAVFVDGCFWHWCEEHAQLPKANAALWQAKLLANRQRDAWHDAVLRSEGWAVIRIWEHDEVQRGADLVEAALDRWHRIACGHHGHRVNPPRRTPPAPRQRPPPAADRRPPGSPARSATRSGTRPPPLAPRSPRARPCGAGPPRAERA